MCVDDSVDLRPSSDSQLVDAVARGDASALAELHRRHSVAVFSRALSLSRDGALADESTHDVFIQLWRDAAQYDDAKGNVRAWLSVMARSRTIDRLRARKRREQRLRPLDTLDTLDTLDPPLRAPSQELAMRTRQDAALIESVLEILPDPERRLIELAFFEGLTHNEIAEGERQPLGTVKTRIRRALGLLHVAIAARERAPFTWNRWRPAAPVPAMALQNLNVLIVDDEPETLTLLMLVLQRAGAAVVPASSAVQALRRLDAIWPDVLVTDLEMPDQDGYALLQRVRNLDRGRRLRAVAFTAHGGDGDRERMLKAGFDLHLSKPVRPAVLVTRLARLMTSSRPGGATEARPAMTPSTA